MPHPVTQSTTDLGLIHISGRIDFDSVANYRQLGEEMIESNTQADLRFDLSGADIGGSIGVSLLLCWVRCATKHGKQLKFQQIPENLCEMIRVSGVEQMLTFE